MEMCYDGALVMPQNFSVVTADEMEYIDGGGVLYDLAISILGGLVSCAIFHYHSTMVKGLVAAAVATYNWIASVVSAAAAFVVANPVLCAAILAGITGAVIAVLKIWNLKTNWRNHLVLQQ